MFRKFCGDGGLGTVSEKTSGILDNSIIQINPPTLFIIIIAHKPHSNNNIKYNPTGSSTLCLRIAMHG